MQPLPAIGCPHACSWNRSQRSECLTPVYGHIAPRAATPLGRGLGKVSAEGWDNSGPIPLANLGRSVGRPGMRPGAGLGRGIGQLEAEVWSHSGPRSGKGLGRGLGEHKADISGKSFPKCGQAWAEALGRAGLHVLRK